MADELTAVVYRFRDFEVDERAFQLRRGGQPLPITRQVFDFIRFLLRHRDRPVTKSELLDTIWAGRVVGDESVSRCVSTARRLLGDSGETQHTIKTIHGRGYWFVAPVEVGGDAAPSLRLQSPVGRDEPLNQIRRALARAKSGRGSVVLLAGEAGIGKTVIAEHICHEAISQGFEASIGRCCEEDGAPPAWPWWQVLRGVLGAAVVELSELELRAAADVAITVPEILGAVPGLVPSPAIGEADRFRSLDAVSRLLVKMSERQPFLAIVDDLHRADSSTLFPLARLCDSIATSRMVVLGTFREDELARCPESAAQISALLRSPSSEAIELAPLSVDDVREFIRLETGKRPSDSEAASLCERSGGNPFFLSQILSAMPDGGLVKAESLPTSLREAIFRHISALSRETRDVLVTGSVFGREFSSRAVAIAGNVDPGTVLRHLGPAVNGGVIARVEGSAEHFKFRHIVLRDALYAGIGIAEKTRMHLCAGEALEELYADLVGPHLGWMAEHFLQAGPLADPSTTVRHCLGAAEWLTRHLAHAEAADYLARAVSAAEGGVGIGALEFCDLLLSCGGSQVRAGRRAQAGVSFDRAAETADVLGEPRRFARAAVSVSPDVLAIETGVVDRLHVKLLKSAIGMIKRGDQQLRAELYSRLALASYWEGDGTDCREAAISARQAADLTGNGGAEAWALISEIVAEWSPLSHAARASAIPRARSLAIAADSTELDLLLGIFQIATSLECGDIDSVDREVATLERNASTPMHPQARWYPALYRCMRATMQGRYRSAQELAHEFLDVGQSYGDVNAAQSYGVLVAEAHWQLGQVGSVRALVAEFANRFGAVSAWRCVEAMFDLDLGERDAASAKFRSLMASLKSGMRRDTTWLMAIAVLAQICSSVGDKKDAEALYTALLPYSALHVTVGFGILYWGTVADRLAMLARFAGNLELSEQFARRGRSMNEAAGASPWVVRSDLELLRIESARGGPRRRMVERFGGLPAAAEALGMATVEGECRALLE